MNDQNEATAVSDITDEELLSPGFKEALVEELKERVTLSVQYKEDMDEAKTTVKREHFRKKLARHNEETVDLFSVLEKIAEAEKTND